jgi:hypothetical protein
VKATKTATSSRRFILCPICGAKSKKLGSYFGGVQVRVCRGQARHRFEIDTFMGMRRYIKDDY